jgi:hypothetical protein
MPIRDKLLSLATHDLRVAFADAWVAPTKGGGDPFFNADEVLVLKAAIDIAADGGFFVTDDHLIDLMRAILNAEDRAVSHVSGKDVTIDRDFVRKWRARHKVKRYKTASLDPKRAEKATVEVRDGWLASCRTCVVSIRLLAHALSCRIDTCSARGEESLLPERQVRQVSNLHVRHEEKGTKSKREPSVESTRGEEGKRAKAREHSRAKCLGSLQNTPPLNQITSNVD